MRLLRRRQLEANQIPETRSLPQDWFSELRLLVSVSAFLAMLYFNGFWFGSHHFWLVVLATMFCVFVFAASDYFGGLVSVLVMVITINYIGFGFFDWRFWLLLVVAAILIFETVLHLTHDVD